MLLEAHPRLDGTRVPKPRVKSEMPSPYAVPDGCRFHTRCPLAEDVCLRIDPPEVPIDSEPEHSSACHVLPRKDAAPVSAAGG
jgi:oligopeptide/dipeptide ABC transporter ATP-binding protein